MKNQHQRIAQFSALTLLGLLTAGQTASAQATGGFTPGNVVVLAIDGSLNPMTLLADTPDLNDGIIHVDIPTSLTNTTGTTLGKFGQLVKLIELQPGGTATGKYYNLPYLLNGNNHRLTLSGTAGSVGGMSVSLNGKYLMCAALDTALGQYGPTKPNFAVARTTSKNFPRTIALIDWTNPDPATAIDSSTALHNAFNQENITDVAWTGLDSDPLFAAGNGEPPTFYDPVKMTGTYSVGFGATTGGIITAPRGASTATQNYAGGASSVENITRVKLYNGVLYGSASDAGTSDSNNQPQGQHLYGLAVLTPGATTPLPGFATDTATSSAGPNPYDFFFDTQLIEGIPTPVVYVADGGTVTGGIQKWIYHADTGQWGYKAFPTDTFNTPDYTFGNLILSGLAGTYNAQGQVVIYGIANGTKIKGAPTTLVTWTDDGTNSAPVQINAPVDSTVQQWRGVEVIPPTMSGRVDLGVADLTTISPGAPLGNVTVAYRLVGTTTPYFTQTAPLTVDASAHNFADYTLPGVAPGFYDLKIKTTKNLAVVLHNVKVGGPFTLPDVALPGGDANNDNVVDGLDFGAIVNAYGTTYDPADPNTGYDPQADFNFDGSVDGIDFGTLVNYYGTTGDM